MGERNNPSGPWWRTSFRKHTLADYPAINGPQLKEMLLEDWHPPDRRALIEDLDHRRARAKRGSTRRWRAA
jgi:hypothetical protein